MQSEQINELATALSKAQGSMKGAQKDAKGNFGKYATLDQVWDTIREPLSKNGLSVVQATKRDDKGIVMVSTLLHTSGQWMKSETPLVDTGKGGAHGFGASMSYTRRYSLSALVGVTLDDDDDAAEIQKGYEQKAQKVQKPKEPQSSSNTGELISKEEAQGLQDLIRPTDQGFKLWLLAEYSKKEGKTISAFSELPRKHYRDCLNVVENRASVAL